MLLLSCLVLPCLVSSRLALPCLVFVLSCLVLRSLVSRCFVFVFVLSLSLSLSCLVLRRASKQGHTKLLKKLKKTEKKWTTTVRGGEVDIIKLRQDSVRCDNLAYLPYGFNQLRLLVFAEIIRQALQAVLCGTLLLLLR